MRRPTIACRAAARGGRDVGPKHVSPLMPSGDSVWGAFACSARRGGRRRAVSSAVRIYHLRGDQCERRSSLRDGGQDRKSTRLNSSHGYISYAVFCLKKKNRCI